MPPPTAARPSVRSRAAAAARASADPTKKAVDADVSVAGGSSSRAAPSPSKPTAPPPSGKAASVRSTQRMSSTTRSTGAEKVMTSPTAPAGGAVAFPKALSDAQRPLYMSLRDELASVTSHPLLPSSTIETAKGVFEGYVLEQWASDRGLTSTGVTAEHVEQILADLGVPATPNDVRDLLFDLSQGPDVAFHNAKVAAQAAVLAAASSDDDGVTASTVTPRPPEGTAQATVVSPVTSVPAASAGRSSNNTTPTNTGARSTAPSATTAAASAALRAQANQTQTVSFAQFLDLLATTLGDCAYREEMATLWHFLDADGDDTLSFRDVKQAVAQLAEYSADTGAARAYLASLQLSDNRLKDLLEELDVDDDGVVTKRDFLSSANAN